MAQELFKRNFLRDQQILGIAHIFIKNMYVWKFSEIELIPTVISEQKRYYGSMAAVNDHVKGDNIT